jgi:GalNAc-alpha-(1->4)-GalNAc-alpha-(1->3)-diNAcBac-PP-undecaprenol alpha-1,4-N-acetyl-D-galactosaminyltransferase
MLFTRESLGHVTKFHVRIAPMANGVKRIALFTRKMNGVMGGLERQILEIAKILVDAGFAVTIITLDQGDIKTFFQDPLQGINFISLDEGDPDIPSNMTTRIRRQLKMYHLIKKLKPDLGIAFMYGGYVMSRVPMLLCNSPVILAERNSPAMYSLTRISRFRHFLYISMILANRITVQFNSYVTKYPWYLRKKIVVIPNTIHDVGLVVHKNEKNLKFVYAGRFSFQKQIPRLLTAFSNFHSMYPNTTLTLYGEGETQNEISRIISQLKMDSYTFCLKPTDIEVILQNTDVMCVLSKWEGFPNTLAESLKAGVPAIGFSNCDGVSDLIRDKSNGWLEKDLGEDLEIQKLLERSYADVVNGALSRSQIRASMDMYSEKRIHTQWKTLVSQVITEIS